MCDNTHNGKKSGPACHSPYRKHSSILWARSVGQAMSIERRRFVVPPVAPISIRVRAKMKGRAMYEEDLESDLKFLARELSKQERPAS